MRTDFEVFLRVECFSNLFQAMLSSPQVVGLLRRQFASIEVVLLLKRVRIIAFVVVEM